MQPGGAPPPEAVRGGRPFSNVVVIAIAVLMFMAGVGVGWIVFSPPPERPVELKIATNTPFPPFEFYEDGNLVGFDIEMITEIMNRTGHQFRILDFPDFASMLLSIEGGAADIGVGALTMNLETGAQRNETMDFTIPYFEADQGVLKRLNDATNYCADANDCTATDLNVTGLRIAVQDSTTSKFWLDDNAPAATVTVFPTVSQVLAELSAARVHLVLIDKPAADGIVLQMTDLALAGVVQTNELYGFAVPNNDPRGLVPQMNQALQAMMQDGTYDRLFEKWFGAPPPEGWLGR
jgi:polar amino acid transport system substrate-binding protein